MQFASDFPRQKAPTSLRIDRSERKRGISHLRRRVRGLGISICEPRPAVRESCKSDRRPKWPLRLT